MNEGRLVVTQVLGMVNRKQLLPYCKHQPEKQAGREGEKEKTVIIPVWAHLHSKRREGDGEREPDRVLELKFAQNWTGATCVWKKSDVLCEETHGNEL